MRVEQPPAIVSWPRARRLLVGLLQKMVHCLCGSKSGGRAPPEDQALPDLQAWFTEGRKGNA